MPTLIEHVTATPPRAVGAPDWFTTLKPEQQQDVRDLLTAKLRDSGSVQHSILQLAEILIEHFGLQVRVGTVRARLAELTREIQQCPPRTSKKK